MAITLHYLSGSPFSWRVWLALEHKGLPHALQVLNADAGHLKKPDYLAISPHGKAPVIEVDGFALYESSAIIEYLEEAFSHLGPSLWPTDLRQRAIARRLVAEVDAYLYPPVRRCVEQLLLRREGSPDEAVIEQARQTISFTLALFDSAVTGPLLMGTQPCAADFALYPLTAMLTRLDLRHPQRDFAALLSPRLERWRAQVQALPYFEKTCPPHWRG